MEVWILRGTDPETLEEKINKQLEEVEKVKSLFHTPTVQYQGGVFSNGCSRSKTVIPGSVGGSR